MYVRNSNQIKGHILICVIALGVLKLLQWKLNNSGTSPTIPEIIRALNSATTVSIKSGDELMFLQCSRPQNIRKGLKGLNQEELKAVLAESRNQRIQLEILFNTVGLVPPARLVNLKAMGRCLGVDLQQRRLFWNWLKTCSSMFKNNKFKKALNSPIIKELRAFYLPDSAKFGL